ncbi:MAG: GAF domain-containing protein [Hymenobacter sp.]|nr:MAG: GAF domain-containing protein [Hymenobacter sp.]
MPYPHLEPANEPARLLVMQKYGVQAALQEPVFQELTTLATHIFGLPMAFLSVVDSAYVDFPATHGVLGLRTLPRKAALCAMVVQQHATVVLNGISAGSDSPQRQTAQRFRMEFYAGAPLLVEQHYAVGALCLSDNQSRVFSAQEELVLNELAELISQVVVRRWQHLAEVGGARRWQATQQLVIEDARMLHLLIRHLRAQHTSSILHVVQRRLASLKKTVNGKLFSLLNADSPAYPCPSA